MAQSILAAFTSLHERKPLPFDPTKLDGLSEKLIRSHWENNYGGSVKALNTAKQHLAGMLDDPNLPSFVAATFPLLVMDMYEHCYQMDYGAAAPAYVDAFFRNIHWETVGVRMDKAHKIQRK
jgi:superoxide dismutase